MAVCEAAYSAIHLSTIQRTIHPTPHIVPSAQRTIFLVAATSDLASVARSRHIAEVIAQRALQLRARQPRPANEPMAAASVDETMRAINAACRAKGGAHAGYSCKVVSWDDVSRGTVGGNLSCWGANITDTYLKSKDGAQLFTVYPPAGVPVYHAKRSLTGSHCSGCSCSVTP